MFALLLAGGLRTFLITWPLTRESVVDVNGGRNNFWIGISAPFSGEQRELAVAARELCVRERFDFCDIRLENVSSTREFYKGTPRWPANFWGPGAQQKPFALQWESVTRVFQELESSAVAPELVLRTRPDVALFRPVHLAKLLSEMRNQSTNVSIPCTFGKDRVIDDFIVATPVAMRAYAARLTGPVGGGCESHVGAVLGGNFIINRVQHAILDFPYVDNYVQRAEYKTVKHHNRCLNTKPARKGRDVAAFNSTDYDIVRRYVSEQINTTHRENDLTTTNRLNIV
ncbi:hypothetical protein M885DRAFT_568718 [Pelagophyceae sp. CCMP2097]|nr:hypothetical protein M885DRAFT_568718 [Pelagophyceae sp. CCMP2097]